MLLTTSCLLAFVLLFLVIALGVSIGELSIPLNNVFYAISNKLGLTDVPLNRIYESVIWDFRLSRALVAACWSRVGHLRGRIAEPFEECAGGTLRARRVGGSVNRGGVSRRIGSRHRRSVAFCGRVCRSLRRLCLRRLPDQRARAAMNARSAGVAASQLFNAITAYTISTSASAQQARDVMFWLLGSFSGVRWPEFQLALVVVLAGLAVCLYYSRALDAFTFGDDAAASLGIAVPGARPCLPPPP